MAAFAKYFRGESGLPHELTEADICERFGWTFSQLDEEDVDRVFTAFAMQNVRTYLQEIKSWLDHVGKTHISEQALRMYGRILEAEREVDND